MKAKLFNQIMRYNRGIDRNIQDKQFKNAEFYILKLHELERKQRVPMGSFRIKKAQTTAIA